MLKVRCGKLISILFPQESIIYGSSVHVFQCHAAFSTKYFCIVMISLNFQVVSLWHRWDHKTESFFFISVQNIRRSCLPANSLGCCFFFALGPAPFFFPLNHFSRIRFSGHRRRINFYSMRQATIYSVFVICHR